MLRSKPEFNLKRKVKPLRWNRSGFWKQMHSECTCPLTMSHLWELCPSCEKEYQRICEEEALARFNVQLDEFLAAPVQEVR